MINGIGEMSLLILRELEMGSCVGYQRERGLSKFDYLFRVTEE